MTDSASPLPNHSADFVATQEILMHMQHDLETMHEVLLSQQQQIEELKSSLMRVEQRLEQTQAADDTPSPLDERPPHY